MGVCLLVSTTSVSAAAITTTATAVTHSGPHALLHSLEFGDLVRGHEFCITGRSCVLQCF